MPLISWTKSYKLIINKFNFKIFIIFQLHLLVSWLFYSVLHFHSLLLMYFFQEARMIFILYFLSYCQCSRSYLGFNLLNHLRLSMGTNLCLHFIVDSELDIRFLCNRLDLFISGSICSKHNAIRNVFLYVCWKSLHFFTSK